MSRCPIGSRVVDLEFAFRATRTRLSAAKVTSQRQQACQYARRTLVGGRLDALLDILLLLHLAVPARGDLLLKEEDGDGGEDDGNGGGERSPLCRFGGGQVHLLAEALVEDVEGVDEEADAHEDGQEDEGAVERVLGAQDERAGQPKEERGDNAARQGREHPRDDHSRDPFHREVFLLVDVVPDDALGAVRDEAKADEATARRQSARQRREGVSTPASAQESESAPDDGVRGGDGELEVRRDHEPCARGGERAEHAVHENLRLVHKVVGVDDAAADCGGDAAAEEERAGKLHDGGDARRLEERQRLAAHGRGEGVGDVVGADAVGHEERHEGACTCMIGGEVQAWRRQRLCSIRRRSRRPGALQCVKVEP